MVTIQSFKQLIPTLNLIHQSDSQNRLQLSERQLVFLLGKPDAICSNIILPLKEYVEGQNCFDLEFEMMSSDQLTKEYAKELLISNRKDGGICVIKNFREFAERLDVNDQIFIIDTMRKSHRDIIFVESESNTSKWPPSCIHRFINKGGICVLMNFCE